MPGHISLYCMTDKVDDEDEGRIYEACDIRLYFLNDSLSEKEEIEGCPEETFKYTQVKRAETPIFFRFGMQ